MRALITGGSRGIGLGIAKALAAIGYDLTINGMRPESDVRDILTSLGPNTVYLQGDVSTDEFRKKLRENLTSYPIDLFISNAGIAPTVRLDLLALDEGSYDRLMDVNLKAVVFILKDIAAHFIANQNGRIVVVSSISASSASINRGEYCISKAGLAMATKLFALRLASENIPVFEIRPGVIATDMTAGVKDKYDGMIANGLIPQNRWGMPEDIGKVVTSIAAGHLDYATGQVIIVDGGITLERL